MTHLGLSLNSASQGVSLLSPPYLHLVMWRVIIGFTRISPDIVHHTANILSLSSLDWIIWEMFKIDVSGPRTDDVIDVRPLTCVARIILRLPPVPVPGVGELLPRLVPPPPPREQLVPHPEPGRVSLNISGGAPQI